VNGGISAVFAIVVGVTAGWCAVAFCAALAYSAGPVFAFVIGATIGSGAVCSIASGCIAASADLTRAINKKDPGAAMYGQFANIAENLVTAVRADSPAGNALVAALNGKVRAIFQSICGRHSVDTPAAMPARSFGPVVKRLK